MYKFLPKVFIVFNILLFTKAVEAQYYAWAKNQTGVDNTYCMGMTTDKYGNVFVTGNFNGASATFGNFTLTNVSNSFPDFYLVKYDPNGNVMWARSAGGTNRETGNGLATDANGNVYVCGWYASPTLTFGSYTLTNTAQYFYDMFVVKYDSSGNVLWAKSSGGTNDDRALATTIDAKGNLYVTGIYKSFTMTFGSSTISNINAGNEDIFLVKYDPSGNVIRAASYGGVAPDWGAALAVDENYNLYLAGLYYSPSITFGTKTINSNGGQTDMYVAKFDSAGSPLWVNTAGGSNYDAAGAVSADKNGNVYVSGYFQSSSITFGTNTLVDSSTNKADAYIVKYDYLGNVQWAKSANGSQVEYGNAVVADAIGNIYFTGTFSSSQLNFGSFTLLNKGNDDIFIVKLDPLGNIISAKSAGGTQNDDVQYASIDANNNLFLAGTFSSPSLIFGKDSLKNNGPYEMFVTKLTAFPAGITKSASEEYIKISPNPSKGNFTISLPETMNKGYVEIYSIIGEKIKSLPIDESSLKNIDLDNISSGIYFIRISDEEKKYTKKIIIE